MAIYYGDEDDVSFDKDVLISYWSKGWWGYNLASPQYLPDKGYKFPQYKRGLVLCFGPQEIKAIHSIKLFNIQKPFHLNN